MTRHEGLDWLHRVYWRLLDDHGEANWEARETVAGLIIKLLRESRKRAAVAL